MEIPYEGTTLPGCFCQAANVQGPTRTLIATNGYDSTVHESYFAFAVAASRRGYHCLLFDGPGQGSALIEQGLRMRPDCENVVRPVVGYALSRPRSILSGLRWPAGVSAAISRCAARAASPGLAPASWIRPLPGFGTA